MSKTSFPRDDLTLEEIAQLRALGPARYKQGVVSLFASGEATTTQWDALATILQRAGQRETRWRTLTADTFRQRHASTHEWVMMAQAVWHWSEISNGAPCTPIDRAVLARAFPPLPRVGFGDGGTMVP